MSTTQVLLIPLDQVSKTDLGSFRTKVLSCIHSGDRLISMFGTPSSGLPTNSPTLHAVFVSKTQGLIHFCGQPTANEAFPSLTAKFPEFHCFEREIFEQFAMEMEGHPWLKPIRFEGKNLKRMNDYPFYKLEGKEIHEVGVGPIHAGVIEPGHFRFMCYGEKVFHLEIHLGYQHRGAEAMLRKASPRRISPIIESIAGDSAVGYTLGFCRAWEALCGLEVQQDIEVIRGIALELERVAMHLVGLSGLATDVAFLPGSSTYGRLRTSAINLSMRQCGSRFGRSWFRPGELRFPMKQSHRDDIRKTVQQVQTDIRFINKLFQNSKTVQHRLKTTGTVPTELAREIGLVGMSGRASGLSCDIRNELRGGAYKAHPIPLVVESSGDCWARGLIRIHEIDESLKWITEAIDELGDVESESPPKAIAKSNTGVISIEEGWRGEIVHYIETDANGEICYYKVQDPSIRNWFGLAQSVKDNAIYDFPICNKSFDLSYCGNDL